MCFKSVFSEGRGSGMGGQTGLDVVVGEKEKEAENNKLEEAEM